MPHATSPTGDLQEILKSLGEHEIRTLLSSLPMAVGFWSVMLGAMRVYGSINVGSSAMAQLNLSACAYHRILKLARTIASLAGCKEIQSVHTVEASHASHLSEFSGG